MNKFFLLLFSLPKTIYFNLRYLEWHIAYKLPIFISKNVVLKTTKGKIILNTPIKPGMIKIGFNDISIFDKSRSKTIWDLNGTVVFKGACSIGHGSKISVSPNGYLEFGNNFCINAESTIVCSKNIKFSDNVLCSWNNLIMDSDFHSIYDDTKTKINPDEPIFISNNVWIGCNSIILKGATIPENSVIGAGSLVTNKFEECNTIIAGRPAKKIKSDITWQI